VTRRGVGCAILTVGALGLSAASFAILARGPELATRTGRHLVAGALANLSLALLMALLAAIPLRRGERWALWAYLAPLLLYGLPILVIDAMNVAPARLARTLAPQILGLASVVVGLAVVGPTLRKQGRPPTPREPR
jgi:hypothetical protein